MPLIRHQSESFTQLIRYGVIGVSTNLAGYLLYLGLTYLGTSPKFTMSGLYLLGATTSFVLNRKLTFEHKGNQMGAGVRFILAHCAGYLINLAMLIIWVDRLGFAHQWVQACAILVVAGFLFISFKIFVFPQTADTGAA